MGYFSRGVQAAARVNERVWRGSDPLEDRGSQPRGRRKRFYETRRLERIFHLHPTNRFKNGGHKIHQGQYERGGRQRGARRIFAARHRARFHAAHLVPAIHVRRILRRCGWYAGILVSKLALVMMMLRDLAIPACAAVHTIGHQGSNRQRRVQKCHRQETNPGHDRSNALVSCHKFRSRTLPQ